MSDESSAQWRVPFALQMLPGIALLCGLPFFAESPRWLVEHNKVDEARHALSRMRSRPADDIVVEQELSDIEKDFHGHKKLSTISQLKIACSSKELFYRFTMANILMFWQQWTGTNCEVTSIEWTRKLLMSLQRLITTPLSRYAWHIREAS